MDINYISMLDKNSDKKGTCCVVMITHKPSLSGDEELSFKRCIDVCSPNRDVYLVIPDNIPQDYYKNLSKDLKIETIGNEWLSTYTNYNILVCCSLLYHKFKNYDYILVYQTDCWIYEDRLDYFVSLGYDYYGAPWPHHNDTVGNGGFSLRKVSKMIEITEKYPPIQGEPEDVWLCQRHGSDLNICDLKTACNFSMEVLTKRYADLIETEPMGLHSWMMRRFWGEKDKFKK